MQQQAPSHGRKFSWHFLKSSGNNGAAGCAGLGLFLGLDLCDVHASHLVQTVLYRSIYSLGYMSGPG